MIIGIDGTTLAIPFPCGSKHYAQQLTLALARLDKTNQYLVFSKRPILIPNQSNFRLISIPSWIPILKRQFLLSFFAEKEGVDVFHFFEPFGSAYTHNLKVVTTVYDFDLGKIYPKIKSPRQLIHRIYAELVRRFTLQNTAHLISVSNYTKKQLKGYLEKRGMKQPISVIYPAPASGFRVLRGRSKKNFLMCMGDYSPRKNIPKIMEAYSKLDITFKKIYKLKIIVSTKIPYREFLTKARKLGILKYVQLINSPSLDELVKLYNQANVFLFPSLYEGFGLPILEAMACGCPVITSGRGATKEVAHDAALFVNPDSAKDITEKINKILKDKKLTSRYIKKGLKRVNDFSWDLAARKTLAVYNKVHRSKLSR